jgi:hypothetical protein
MIATRVLRLSLPAGEVTVTVELGPLDGSGKSWRCGYGIDWPSRPRRHIAHGVDAIQAIHQALLMVGTELYTSDYHAKGQLSWEKAGDGYGFPVPASIRDVLVGADREFLG